MNFDGADADQEAVDDGQRQRQADLDPRVRGTLEIGDRCRAGPRCCGGPTSMPTPRPLRLVTGSAVEKPGSKIRVARMSVRAARRRGSTRPRSQARASTARGRCRDRRPDQDQDAAGLVARGQRQPALRGLPAAQAFCSGVSRPWSSALRTRCISGSAMRSTTDLSSSVSPPTISKARRPCRARRRCRAPRGGSARRSRRSAPCAAAACRCGSPRRGW